MAVSPTQVVSLIFSFVFLDFITLSEMSTEFNTLVFKGCASQNFPEPSGASKTTLDSLLNSLVSQSSTQTFYNTSANGGTSLTGLFQCRGDLTNVQCHDCVSKAQNSAIKLCKNAISGRIQFNGCYLKYQADSFDDVSGVQLLYKVCAANQIPISGFDEMRVTALGMIVAGVSNGNRFYTGSYQSLYVLGQCEADLSGGDCGSCVEAAIAAAKTQCGEAPSAQIYLNRCFVSYTYFSGKGPQIAAASTGSSENTQRTVAIAVGCVAAIGFLIVLLVSLKSYLKRRLGKLDDW